MRRAGALLALLPLAASAMEGHDPIVSIDEVCVLMACRAPARVRLEGPGGPVEADFGKSPYVFQGVVSVLAGETLLLEAEVREGELYNLRHVKAVAQPAGTLRVGLRQVAAGPRMALSLHNPFDRPMWMRAAVLLANGRVPENREGCRIPPGAQGTQTWTEPVLQAFLVDLRFAEAADTSPCR